LTFPTAQTSLVEAAATPKSASSKKRVSTPWKIVQFRPSQCSASVPRPKWLPEQQSDPTAQASPAEIVVTAFSWLLPANAFGLGTILQRDGLAPIAGCADASSPTARSATDQLRAKRTAFIGHLRLPCSARDYAPRAPIGFTGPG